jgi:polyhydroxyalkanoate synthesis regulator protein
VDEKFLEFWGNLLLNAAKSKQQTEALMRWLRMGFPGMTSPPSSKRSATGFDEMIATFQKLYGLEDTSEKKQDPQKTWSEAMEEFQKSFQDSLAFYGVVPKKEHLTLVEKYEKLKAKCNDQEETIRHLRMLLSDRKEVESDTTTQLQDIVRNQGELFQKMMTDFSQCFSSEKPTPETQAKKKRKEEDDPPDRPDADV